MGTIELRIGRAGAGKSTQIAEEIATAVKTAPFGPPIFWLVPGDASYATERLLLRHVPAAVRAEVLTLHRLAERVAADTGTRPAQGLNQTGKRLLLASIYQERLTDLNVLKRGTPTAGFLDAILDVFTEFSRHLVQWPQIQSDLAGVVANVAQDKSGRSAFAARSLFAKLHDLCVLYTAWEHELQQRQLYDPQQLLARTAQVFSQFTAGQGAVLYVDGFEDFAPDELWFLLEAARFAKHTVIALSADAAWLEADADSLEGVYAPQTVRVVEALQTAAAQAGLQISVAALPHQPGDARFCRRPDLAVLEAGLFHDTTARCGGRAPALHLVAAQNPRAEADGAAESICRLVREQGLSYGDIAILVPRLDDYAALLRDSLARRQVPAYVDQFPSFAMHPLAKFVLTALDVVETRLSMASCVQMLKSDFCGLTREEADWLEGYLRRHELSGVDAFTCEQPWTYAADAISAHDRLETLRADDARADGLRTRLGRILLPFLQDLGEADCDPREVAFALWTLLDRVSAKRITAEWMVNDAAQQSPAEASLHEQAWQRLLGILNDLAETGRDQRLPRSFVFRLIRDDIISQSLSSIPAGADEVLVTEVARATAWDARAVMILGATDGEFPHRLHTSGLLQDDEREAFAQLFGHRLGDTAELRQLFERAVVHRALTRARDHLYVSSPLAGMDGRAVQPSLVIAQIRRLYEPGGVDEQLWMDDAAQGPTTGDAGVTGLTPAVALLRLVAKLRNAATPADAATNGLYDAIWTWFEQEESRHAQLQRALRGLRHRTAAQSLGEDIAAWLYQPPISMNVHQLEAFAACPYRHFASHGLHLEEPNQSGVTAATRGNLIHDALLLFVQRQLSDVAAWRKLSDDEARGRMRASFQAVLDAPQSAPWRRSSVRRSQATEVLQVLEIAAMVLTRHARYGLFEPREMELSFGDRPDDVLPAFEVEVGPGVTVSLRGRVDRIDQVEVDGRLAFRVIDYKSAELDIDLTRVEHGLQLQLPLYAAVIERHAPQLFGQLATPAGVLYIPIRSRVEVRDVPVNEGEARETAIKAMAAKGLLLEDAALVQAMDHRLAAGATELFRQVYKQDGTLAKTAPVLNDDEWQRMTSRVIGHIRAFAGRLLGGDIDIAPFRLQQRTACDFCAFTAVCQIDPRWDKRPFRDLPSFSRDDIVVEWARDAEREEA